MKKSNDFIRMYDSSGDRSGLTLHKEFLDSRIILLTGPIYTELSNKVVSELLFFKSSVEPHRFV